MYQLVIVDDEGKTMVVPLFDDVVTIGRKEGNTIHLPERNISRFHAKLTRMDGQLRVEDFSSYTGVIVNGKRVQGRAVLSAGDRLTIGDYRMVLQMDPDLHAAHAQSAPGRITVPEVRLGGALPEPFQTMPDIRPRSSFSSHEERATAPDPMVPMTRLPLVVAFGIIVTAAMFAGLMVYNAYQDRQHVAHETTAGTAIIESGQQFWGALRDCQQALQSQDYAHAVAFGHKAQELRPDNEQAQACREAAVRAQQEQLAFEQGKAMFEAGRIEDAYAHFQQALGESSAFWSHNEVIETARQYATLRLEQAQKQLRTSPEIARSVVNEILSMHLAPIHVRNEAQALNDKLQGSKPKAPKLVVAEASPKPSSSPEASLVTAATTAQAPAPPPPSATQPVPPSPAPVVVVAAKETETAATGLAAARVCLERGDNACALSALRRASSPAELALRIATYRQMGNTEAAMRDMEVYIHRYPTDTRAIEYREFIRLRNGAPAP